ncbi:methyltransferase domain-containing protein, partial [Candidatus Micrarchaeota archaeon]|nr:methyltransferase domain-containing protein [Candidatus Micrarchaeota archaeon]
MIKRIAFNTDESAAEWYNKRFSDFGVFETTKKYNSLMLEWLEVKEKTEKKLLDVGCGGGFFLKQAEKFLKCFGVDFSLEALIQAKKNCNADLILASASSLPFKDRSFDFVSCLGSLEHFIEMEKALNEMQRVLKNKGKANFYVPNSNFILFKLNKATYFQPNERLASLNEWRKLLEKFFVVEKDFKQ